MGEKGSCETYSEGLEEILGVLVDLELAGLGLGDVESGDLWNVLILALTLLLLKLEGDTADWATLDALHQVGGVTSDLAILLALALIFVFTRSAALHTLLRRRLEAMMAISSQILLLVSKSRVNFG